MAERGRDINFDKQNAFRSKRERNLDLESKWSAIWENSSIFLSKWQKKIRCFIVENFSVYVGFFKRFFTDQKNALDDDNKS